MNAILVDDEPLMIQKFIQASRQLKDFHLIQSFTDAREAYDYICAYPIDAVFLDIHMPFLSGLDLAKRCKLQKPDLLLVFVTASSDYIREANEIGVDYYILKPYSEQVLASTVNRLQKLLPPKAEKSISIHTFGRFTVFKDSKPIPLRGKAKEILALVVSRHGKEVSNEEIYSLIWEEREYDNVHMKVYYNALRRLRDTLKDAGISDLLVSTTHGQMINLDLCDCDYFSWLKSAPDSKRGFEGEFLSEYSWAEPMLAEMLDLWSISK